MKRSNKDGLECVIIFLMFFPTGLMFMTGWKALAILWFFGMIIFVELFADELGLS